MNQNFFKFSFSGILILIILNVTAIAQTPSSANFNLIWKTIAAGGNEGDDITSESFKLSSVVGQPTAHDSIWLTGTYYLIHPGFRKVDLDWRIPLTHFFGDVATYDSIATDSIFVEWTGIDTTLEEGLGWGIWVYDIQYREGPSGFWIDILSSVSDTNYWYSGMKDSVWYYFRVRAHDLATNVPNWDTSITYVAFDSVLCWLTQWLLVVKTNFSGGVIIVDGSIETSPYEEYFSFATTMIITAYDTIYQGDSIRYIFQQWNDGDTYHTRTITATCDTEFIAEYFTQYRLIVANPDGFDTPDPDTGSYWFDGGKFVEAEITTTPVVATAESTAYCIGFYGSGSVPDSGFGSSVAFNIDEPSELAWRWSVVPKGTPECTLYVYSPHGHPIPSDTTVYPCGITINAFVEDSSFEDTIWHYCTGWLGGGSVSSTGSENHTSFDLDLTSWIVWVWDSLQVLPLLVLNDGITPSDTDGYDSPNPTPGIHWIELDSFITVSINCYDSDNNVSCAGYWSSIFPHAGIDTSINFVMKEPTWVQWRWFDSDTKMVCLRVWSEYDSPIPPVGITCYPIGTEITANVTPMTLDSHYCTGYWGLGSVPTDTSGVDTTPWEFSCTLNTNSELVWIWDTLQRFPLLVNNEGVTIYDIDGYDSPDPTVGIHWFFSGDSVFANINKYDSTASMQCIGFWGNGSVPLTSADTSVLFAIQKPSIINWRWANIDTEIICITVYSEYGSPIPPIGTSCYPINTIIEAFVSESVYIDSLGWILNYGWRGGGSVPETGLTDSFSFEIDTSSWLVWQWDSLTRWPFIVLSDHGEPNPPVGVHWYNNEDTVIGNVDPIDGLWRCIGYNGFGDLDSSLAHFFKFEITTLSGVEWIWSTSAHRVIVQKDPLENVHGRIIINSSIFEFTAAETVYVEEDDSLALYVSSYDYKSDSLTRYVFSDWEDTSPDSSRTVIISKDTLFTANYNIEHLIAFQRNPLDDIYGSLNVDTLNFTDLEAVEQDFWFKESTIHRFEVSESDSSLTTIYNFLQWEDSSSSKIRTLTVSKPETLIAYFERSYLIVVEKDPAETYGCFYLPDTTICFVSSVSFWADENTYIEFAVSYRDTVPGSDSMYTFEEWEDGGIDSLHEEFIVTKSDTFTASYKSETYTICLEINQYSSTGGADSLCWNPGTVNISETHTMGSGSSRGRMIVENCGDVNIRLSLRIYGAYNVDTGDTIPWSPNYASGINKYVLRASFQNSDMPPVSYLPLKDYITRDWKIATTSIETPSSVFGPYGGFIQPTKNNYLFMQFISPTLSSVYGEPIVIIVNIRAQMRLP